MTDWLTGRVASLGTRVGFKVGSGAARCFPGTVFRVSDQLATAAFCLFRGFRTRSTRNIQTAFGTSLDSSAAQSLAQRSLRNFFRAFVEAARAVDAPDDELRRIPLVGREHLDAALGKGKGVLVLSAHLGNFLLIGSRLTVEGYPTAVLINQPRDGQFADLMDRYRLRVRQRTIHARPRREALRELNEWLRQNGAAVMIADEYRRGEGVPVTLFGLTVKARRGPVTLALRTGAAVVPACMIRQPDDSLKLIVEPELELIRDGRGAEAIQANTIVITQWLERTVRRHPDQWNWMNIRWSEPIPGAVNDIRTSNID